MTEKTTAKSKDKSVEPDHKPAHAHGLHLQKHRLIAASITAFMAAVVGFILYGTTLSLAPIYAGTARVPTGFRPNHSTASIKDAAKAYQFTINYPDKSTKTFHMEDAGISVNEAASLSDINRRLRLAGPRRLAWWRPMQYTLALKTDQQKLDEFINSAASTANQPASDASLDLSSGKPVVVEHKVGSNYSIPGGGNYLQQKLARLDPATLTLTPQTVQPAITIKEAESAKQNVESLINRPIVLNIAGQSVSPQSSDIVNWVDINPVPEKHTIDISLNSGNVAAYINAVSRRYTSPPVSQVNMTNSDGSVSVLIAGKNGLDIPGKDKIAADLVKQLSSGNGQVSVELPVAYQTHGVVNAGDYPKMLIADLTTKRMYAYEHSELVNSFLISAGAPATPTVTGQFQIFSKFPVQTMTGRNADGSRYNQPNVRYVNYFYRDYAIHGNYWRPTSYFGNINSSHGCIGVTNTDAAWLYGWADIGTQVITHN